MLSLTAQTLIVPELDPAEIVSEFPDGVVVKSEETKALPDLREISPGVYEIGKLRVDKNTLSVTIPATLNMDEGNLEYLLVSRKGSTHESLLVCEVEPSQLHFAMLLLGAKGAGITTDPTDPAKGQQARTGLEGSGLADPLFEAKVRAYGSPGDTADGSRA